MASGKSPSPWEKPARAHSWVCGKGERIQKKPEAGASGSSIFYTIILIKRIRHEALPCAKVIQMRYVT